MAYRLAQAAEGQIEAILLGSARKHGMEAAARYAQLIRESMSAIAADPRRHGSIEIPRLKGVRAYAIRVGRLKIQPDLRVGTPRHLLVYRVAADGVVEVLGVVHDRMLLSRAARKAVRDARDG
jgi:toxin ParE1/3/4